MEAIAAAMGALTAIPGLPALRVLFRRLLGRSRLRRIALVTAVGVLFSTGAWLLAERAILSGSTARLLAERALVPDSIARRLPESIARRLTSNATAPPPSREGRTPVLRQVTFTGSVVTFDLAPDDRSVAYSTPSGALFVHDLATGRANEVYRASELRDPRWSPDGSEILVSIADSLAPWSAYVIDTGTGSARKIGPPGFRGSDWTPTGRQIAGALLGEGGGARERLLLVDRVTGDTVSYPLNSQIKVFHGLSCSRSGNEVLVWGLSSEGESGCWVGERLGAPFLRVPADPAARGFQWSRNAGELLYLAPQEGSTRLLRVAVDPRRGRVARPPSTVETVSQAAGFAPFHSRDAILYRSGQVLATLWLLERPSEGVWTRRPLLSGTIELFQPRLSPDGRSVAVGRASGEDYGVVLVPLDGGPVRSLAAAGPGAMWTAWSPDGRSIAYRSGAPEHRVQLVGIDGGEPRVLSTLPCHGYIYWSPAGRLRYQPAGAAHGNYLVLDETTGAEEPLLRDPERGSIFQSAVSPDGEWIAAAGNRNEFKGVAVWLIRRSDGSERLLYRKPAAPMGWSRDGAWLYAARVDREGKTGIVETAEVIRISAREGRAERVVELPPGDLSFWSNADISPDGDRIVAAVAQRGLDLWVAEGAAHGGP
jgi:Tol biopolymer transport system component